VHALEQFARYVLRDPSVYALAALVLFFAALLFAVPLFCLLARFLGWPWRRRARS
jgi:hypothetical protein